MTKRAFLLLLGIFLGSLRAMSPASAHPHVFIAATSELLYAPDGSILAVRHSWAFDEMFSAYALQGIATKKRGIYTREELASLAQVNVESLKEFSFFTFARANGKKERFGDPTDYYLEYENAALVLRFTLPFKASFKASRVALEIYDPTYFVDFALKDPEPFRLIGAPASCKTTVQRPADATASAQKLGEDMFTKEANFGAMFANKITVECS